MLDPPLKEKKKYQNTLGRAVFKIGACWAEKRHGVDIKKTGILESLGKFGKHFQDILDESFNDVSTLKDKFKECVTEVLSSSKKSTMIVFIDDLDRCNPENVVNMLESLKNFFFTPNCIFIISADREVVTSGIRQKYHGSEFISGDEYLDKIVNLSFELFLDPKIGLKNIINQYKTTYGSLLGNHKIDFLVDAFELTKSGSLRKARRILDRFVLLKKHLDENNGSLDKDVLFFTIILQELMPQLFADTKKFSNNKILDKISKGGYDSLTKSALDPFSKDLIQRFKTIQYPGPNPNSNEISENVSASIKFIESLTI